MYIYTHIYIYIYTFTGKKFRPISSPIYFYRYSLQWIHLRRQTHHCWPHLQLGLGSWTAGEMLFPDSSNITQNFFFFPFFFLIAMSFNPAVCGFCAAVVYSEAASPHSLSLGLPLPNACICFYTFLSFL
jgi:hypothetical protein